MQLGKEYSMNHSKNHRLQVSMLFVLSTVLSGTMNATTISTVSAWNGTSSFGTLWGEPGSTFPVAVATYGQTFMLPNEDNRLTSFSIWVRDDSPFENDPLVFGGYIMQWNGQRASGPVLYDSGPITLGFNHSWHEVSFNPLDLVLIPGQEYVFIVSASGYFDGLESTAVMSGTFGDPYRSGKMVSLDNGADISQWTTQDWDSNPFSLDTIFTAQFTGPAPVPDPPRASLLAISLAFLACAGIRRKCVMRSLS
jgi:hypothetical protein